MRLHLHPSVKVGGFWRSGVFTTRLFMSPATVAAAALQRPLLLHIPRGSRRLAELYFLGGLAWRRPQQRFWVCSAAKAAEEKPASRKSGRRASAVIESRPAEPQPVEAAGAAARALEDAAAQAVLVPKKRGRGRPKSAASTIQVGTQSVEAQELIPATAVAGIERQLSGDGSGALLPSVKPEEEVKESPPADSEVAVQKPRRARVRKVSVASAVVVDESAPPTGLAVSAEENSTVPKKRATKRKSSVSLASDASSVHEESDDLPLLKAAVEATLSERLATSCSVSVEVPRSRPAFSLPPIDKVAPQKVESVARKSDDSVSTSREDDSDSMGQRPRRGGRSRDGHGRSGSSHATSTISFVQILGTGMDTEDTAPSVLLFFDKRRFIFNAGEGLQRFCIEHKIKLSKIDHLFLTRVTSEAANGIPGLLLTLGNLGDNKEPVNVWGTSELQYFVDAMRTFVPNASVVHTHSFGQAVSHYNSGTDAVDSEVLFHDEFVKISAVLLHPSRSALGDMKHQRSLSDKANSNDGVQENEGFNGHYDGTGSTRESGDTYRAGDVSVVYVCELPQVKGKFDPTKATALGVRPGRKYSELQNGNSVPRDDNTGMVHPDEVMAPPSPGPIFILVDCPTLDHIPALLSSPGLKDFYPGQPPSKLVTCMVHIGPSIVTSDIRYQEWMALFSETSHILAGHGSQNLTSPVLKASAKVISWLNYICPQVFPDCGFVPKDKSDGELNKGLEPAQACDELVEPPQQIPAPTFVITKAANLLKFRLRPLSAVGLDFSSISSAFCPGRLRKHLISDFPDIQRIRDEIAQIWNVASDIRPLPTVGITTQPEAVNTYPVEEPWLHDSSLPPCSSLQQDQVTEVRQEDQAQKNASEMLSGVEEKSDMAQHTLSEDRDNNVLPDCLQNLHRREMEIVFLGTGSSQPSKYRNVSAIYIHLFSRGGIMLDCGEGTYGQLKRRYGLEGADEIVAGLKCVWISHIHADHHTGLSRILAVRKSLLERKGEFSPIPVIGPRQLKRYLDAYTKLEDLGMFFLDCSQTNGEEDDELPSDRSLDRNDVSRGLIHGSVESGVHTSSAVGSKRLKQMHNYWTQPGYNQASRDEVGQEKLKAALASLGLRSLVSVPVVHCPQAFGVILEADKRTDHTGVVRAGWKLAYSGDTRPCRALLNACHGATVLIHEATFDDGMGDEARMKRHSMTCEAIETGRQGKVFRTILTHFSQRYPKIPVFDESYTDSTCIAFDMMSANLADLHLLPKLLPALKLLFREDLIVEEEAADEVEVVEY